MQHILTPRKWILAVGTLLILAGILGFIGIPQAQAAAQGCEHHPVNYIRVWQHA